MINTPAEEMLKLMIDLKDAFVMCNKNVPDTIRNLLKEISFKLEYKDGYVELIPQHDGSKEAREATNYFMNRFPGGN